MASPGSNKYTESIRAFYNQALKFKNAGDFDEAEQICRRANVIYQRDPNILCLLGEILLRQKRPQEAHSWFGMALKNFPDYPRALEGIGRALLAQEKPGKAVPFLQQAAQALPNRYSTHLVLGHALATTGQKPEADAAIKRAVELNPDKAVIARASEALQLDRISEAEKILREHLAEKSDDPVALHLLGVIAMESNRLKPALRLLARSVENAPDFLPARSDLARAQMKGDHFDAALESAEKAIALDPELPHSWVLKGSVLAKAQRHDEALAEYKKALELSPAHGGALAGMGHVLKTVGRQQEAISAYRDCIGSNPALGEAYWSLANLKTFEF